MARRPGWRMSREKLLCGLSVALVASMVLLIGLANAFPQATVLQVYSAFFGSVPPETLEDQAPLTTASAPPSHGSGEVFWDPGPRDMSRNTPFAPPRVKPLGGEEEEKEEEKKKEEGKGEGEIVAVPENPGLDPKATGPVFLDGRSPVAYMGVLGMRGQRYGMLRVKEGRYLNVQEGDKLTDYGCTIVRVEQQAIHLVTREGIYHILRKKG